MNLSVKTNIEKKASNHHRSWDYVSKTLGVYEPVKSDRVSNISPRFVNVGHGIILFISNNQVSYVDPSWKTDDVRFVESLDEVTISFSNKV